MGFAVLIPLVALGDDGRDHLLLEVRSMSVAQPGEICFPGGRMEAGETALEAALRETCEELGVAPESVEILGELEPVRMVTGRCINVVLGRLDPAVLDSLVLSESEVDSVFLLPLEWLRENPPAMIDMEGNAEVPALLASYLKNYDRLSGVTPYWEYDGHGIWGLTAKIINKHMM